MIYDTKEKIIMSKSGKKTMITVIIILIIIVCIEAYFITNSNKKVEDQPTIYANLTEQELNEVKDDTNSEMSLLVNASIVRRLTQYATGAPGILEKLSDVCS